MKAGKVTEFLKAHNCDATLDELKAFVDEKVAKDKPIELDDEELDMVAGGGRFSAYSTQHCSHACTNCDCE